MNDTVTSMIAKLLKRQPTVDDYKIIGDLMIDLPPELLRSPGAVAHIIMLMEHLRRIEAAAKQMTWDGQQRLHDELPKRVEQAALSALNVLRDKLPIDAADRVIRLWKWFTLGGAVIAIFSTVVGWTIAKRQFQESLATSQAATEQSFNNCIDAAEGAAVSAVDRKGNEGRYDPAIYRTRARFCAAQYADRRSFVR